MMSGGSSVVTLYKVRGYAISGFFQLSIESGGDFH